MVESKFTCECGHMKAYHYLNEPHDIPRCSMCQHVQYNSIETRVYAYYPWHLFKPDNLEYLEEQYESRSNADN
jgi:hypothetical protein